MESNENTAIKNAYASLYESFEFGQVNWCKHVKDILDKSDMTTIWDNQYITENEIKSISNILHETFI
jgi:hypothetical protein